MARINDIEKRLWEAADELRANPKLKGSEFSVPLLGLIFLRHADHRFTEGHKELGDLVELGFDAGTDGPSSPPSPYGFGVSCR